MVLWVNLQSKGEVDELFGEWKQAHAATELLTDKLAKTRNNQELLTT